MKSAVFFKEQCGGEKAGYARYDTYKGNHGKPLDFSVKVQNYREDQGNCAKD